ncbi:MAG: hypothetical protein MR821_08105 [Clostridiales bacterium]|nr:hypothetical protein [Clostridiales bacterium]
MAVIWYVPASASVNVPLDWVTVPAGLEANALSGMGVFAATSSVPEVEPVA